MIKIRRKHWYAISRRFWGTVFTLVIALAVIVQLGRQAFPLLNDYREEITSYFGEMLSAKMEVAELDASWTGLRPKLSLSNVVLQTKENEQVFSVDNITMELSIIRSVLNMRLSWRQVKFSSMNFALSQAENGKWSIKGMSAFAKAPQTETKSSTPVIDDPYDVFLFGRRIKIEKANISLEYFNGETSQVLIPEISLENDRNFHRIRAGLDVADKKALSLVVEAHGDPRSSDFVANGFFELKDFPSRRVVDALALGDLVIVEESHNVNLKLWFRSDKDQGTTVRGDVSVEGGVSIKGQDFNLPAYVNSQITGKAHKDKGWQLTLKSMEARWNEDVASPITDFTLYGSGRDLKGLRAKELSAKPWVDLALHVGINDEFAEDVLRRLEPRGAVKDVDVQLTNKESGYFNARARVEGGQVNAVMGSPAIKNLHANVSVSLLGGHADVLVKDGFVLDLPKVYHNALEFQEAQGQISWQLDFKKRIAYLSSGLIQVKNPGEEASGYIRMTLPFAKKYGTQDMTLALGLKNTLARNHKKYVPKTIPKHLYDWLDTSIKEGRVANVEFLYHGSIENDPEVDPTIQLYGEVYDGNLVFDPQWPKLEGVSGSLRLNNEKLDVRIDKASLLGNSVYDAAIRLVGDPAEQGRALSIEGSLLSDASAAITLLKSSPIKEFIGSTFDEWQFSGGVTAKVALLIPLESDSSDLSHKIDVSFNQAKVNMPDIGLVLNDIGGVLHYQTEKGIYAEKLNGTVWGRPFEAAISTVDDGAGNGGQDTLIDFSGRASVSDLYKWTNQPALRFASGESTVLGQLKIPSEISGKPFEVNVASPLVGVELNLPKPLGKTKAKPVAFSSRLRFFDDGEEYQFVLDDDFRLSLFSDIEEKISAKVEFNNFDPKEKSDQRIENTGDYRITGRIPHADLEKWDAVKDQYFVYYEQSSIATDEPDETPVVFDVDIDKFFLGTFEIENLKVRGQREIPYWVLNVESELMSGKVKVPEDERPIALDLEYLRFEDDEDEVLQEESKKSTKKEIVSDSVLADIDLARAVDIDFRADEFSLGGVNYGEWDFKLRTIENGIVVHNIMAKLKGMELGGNDGGQNGGAEFTWFQNPEGQFSIFTGEIKADDLADVFEAWGQEKLIKSKSANIKIDAQWPGAPDEVTVKTIEGLVNIDIEKGSFARGAGGDENALLRLLALFNFDTILRRLRLDFSDLASEGFSYDRVYGNLDFNNGKIYLSEPLIVESSSSKVQLVGTVDAIKEKLDAEMVVTLPLASSAAFATAVVVNLPAAVGLYLMSKMFKKQIDKASSLRVEVKGKWEDPKVKVKKIFNVKDSEKRAKEVKEEQVQDSAQAADVGSESEELVPELEEAQ